MAKYLTRSEAATAKDKAAKLMESTGQSDRAEDFRRMSVEQYAEHRGATLRRRGGGGRRRGSGRGGRRRGMTRRPGRKPWPDVRLIQQARATAGGGRIHQVEQLIGAYRMYAAVLRLRPHDREAQTAFHR